MIAEFAVNNKIYLATKISLFIANYGKELKMEVDIRKKEKVERVTEFVERIKKIQKKSLSSTEKDLRGNKVASR